MKIPLIKPYITEETHKRVAEVLESGYLTEGPVTHEFEQKFADYIGCQHSIAVTSCTTGLELGLRALGIGPGDEVIVPDYTYPATASVVPIVGATAVIVDVDKDSMLIDYDAIEAAITAKTRAIIPVSAFGNPLNYNRLNEIKEKHGVYILEDAAPSVGASYEGKKVGNHADISVFSFHPRKFITTGEGGMITTNNPDWADWMLSYKHFGMDMSGKTRDGIQFKQIGTNYKLSNILAAVGLSQMQVIEKLLNRRIQLAENYKNLLVNNDKVTLPVVTKEGIHSFQSFVIYIENRDQVMKQMRDTGVEVQIGTYALHMHKAYNNHPLVRLEGEMKNSRWCYDHALTLPLFHDLSVPTQQEVVQLLNQYL